MPTLLRSLFAALTLALALPVFAQETTIGVDAAVAVDAPLETGLLWRIDAPDAPAPSYLFGTIHLIGAEDFLLSDSLMSALNRVDEVYFEIDPSAMQNPMAMMPLIQSAMMPAGKSLKGLLSEEEYGRVDAHFSEMGLPMMFLERIKPMFLSILASTDPSDVKGMMGGGNPMDGMSGEDAKIKSYELELNKVAEQLETPVKGLETMAFQMSLFDSIPLEAQAKMLVDAVDHPAAEGDALDAITKVYVTGDIEGMYAMSVDEDGGVGGYEAMLLTNRNRNWVAPIKESVGAGTALFAVGAGHLGGPEGVVKLLEAEGYTLTPISIR